MSQGISKQQIKQRINNIIAWVDTETQGHRGYDQILADVQAKLATLDRSIVSLCALPKSKEAFSGPHHDLMRKIVKSAEWRFDVTFTQIVSKRRHRPTVKARMAAVCVQRAILPLSWKEIARWWGITSHTSIMDIETRAQVKRSEDLKFNDTVETMMREASELYSLCEPLEVA